MICRKEKNIEGKKMNITKHFNRAQQRLNAFNKIRVKHTQLRNSRQDTLATFAALRMVRSHESQKY